MEYCRDKIVDKNMAKEKVKKEKSYLAAECDRIGEIAMHYGFTIIKEPDVNSDDIVSAKQFKSFDYYNDALEKTALTRWYLENNMTEEAQPVMVHWKNHLQGNTSKRKLSKEKYGFEIMGSARSTSEALLIKCALAVLEDIGFVNLYVDINSIGDKESIVRFERELSMYLRKQANSAPAKIREMFKTNHYSILTSSAPELEILRQSAPQTVSSLSDISRAHFKEVLECIEAFNVSYKINPRLLSNKLYASYTVFEIRETDDKNGSTSTGELLAYGYRYNHLAKKIGWKREIPSVGMTITVKKNLKLSKKNFVKDIKKPSYYLVQLGLTAKLKCLNIVEMLRKEKIPVYHSITKDKIVGQLTGAEYMQATHVLIMGQKEACDNTMVVRNISTRQQETVSLSELCQFLKRMER